MSLDGKAPTLHGRALWYREESGRWWVAGWGERDPQLCEAQASDVRLLCACDGTHPPAELARIAGVDVQDALRLVAIWQERLPGSVFWEALKRDEKFAKQSDMALRIAREAYSAEGLSSAPDNRDYHANVIVDAVRQFDEEEPTVSHAYSAPHPGLGGLRYGEAFYDKIASLGVIRPTMTILEIGCGTGRFARGFLDRFAQVRPIDYRTARYTMFDIAPALIASQRALTTDHAARIAMMRGDVEKYVFGQQFDLVMANEMIADLSVELVEKNKLNESTYVKRYDLSCATALPSFLVNVGAIRLLEQVAQVLKPGGYSIVTEYGSRVDHPVAVKLGRHTEHSIHFGHLKAAARQLGLNPTCESLETFLPFDPACEVITDDSLTLLRHLCSRLLNRELPTLAYTRESLRDILGDALDRVGNVEFVPIADRASCMCPGRFLTLLLSRNQGF